MSTIDVIVAVALGVLGLGLLGLLIFVLVYPVIGRFRQNRDLLRFRRALERLELADDAIDEKRYPDAIALLRQCVMYDTVSTRDLINSLRDHHQNILSRSLVIAEELGGRLGNIANIERLFIERSELLSLSIKATERYSRLAQKREQAGKSLPSWTKSDFNKHSSEIRRELARNQEQLRTELEQLFIAITSAAAEGVTYH